MLIESLWHLQALHINALVCIIYKDTGSRPVFTDLLSISRDKASDQIFLLYLFHHVFSLQVGAITTAHDAMIQGKTILLSVSLKGFIFSNTTIIPLL